MATLENSTRKLLQATYTPIRPQESGGSASAAIRAGGRAWEKWGFVASFRPSWSELGELSARYQEAMDRDGTGIDIPRLQKTLNAVAVIQSATPEKGASDALRSVSLFRDLDPDSLSEFASGLIKLRQEKIGAVTKAHELISAAFDKTHLSQGLQKAGGKDPAATEPRGQGNARTPVPLTSSGASVKTLMHWAVQNGVQADAAAQTVHLVENLSFRLDTMTLRDFGALSQDYIDHLIAATDGFRRRMAVEPVGFLHLERLGFTPAGITRGELIHSVPLAPDEEVNIAHKEWSNTSEEFTKIVTDYVEAYSEEGVAEKAELAQAANSQSQHSSGLDTGVTASGSYGSVNITATLGYHVADSSSSSEQTSRKQSMETTRKASSRTKKEHKVSFKVASAAGTEDQAIRKIKNPFPDRAARVDYYQLVRKWKVDLYRYGIRLTYDITIPEPGYDILSKIEEINQTTSELEQGFQFDLSPADITPDSYLDQAARYNAAIDPPKERSKVMLFHDQKQWRPEHHETYLVSFDCDVGEDYVVEEATLDGDEANWGNPNLNFAFVTDHGQEGSRPLNATYLVGLSGKVPIYYVAGALSELIVRVTLNVSLKEEAFREWQIKAWTAIRDAAQSQYEENRQLLKQKLARLQQELGAQDALSLRKIEREEVMKGALRWLFGPSFEFVPSTVSDNLYDENRKVVVTDFIWGAVLSYGEIIKFLHHAIEWENLLYFLYPYFWSHTSRWEMKKYLDHPDPMHRAFLKSGSARVVFTIRPGFEEAFTAFIEQGPFLGRLVPGHPYVSVAEEMRNYADTNYPGLRAANPVEDARPLLSPNQREAWEDMQVIMKLLETYYAAHRTYPSALGDLRSVLPYSDGSGNPPITDVPTQDPWGNDYAYAYPGVHAYRKYDLASYGADGAPGGEGENADITSWAEASLIGTWYEYTPTSALDIAFGETLPSE